MSLLKEFKPALTFVGKFLALYFIGNVVYGLYIESCKENPDLITRAVTAQTSSILNTLGYDTSMDDHPDAPKIALKEAGDVVINVYEGCNGVNVIIVFMAFLFAYGGPARILWVFLPLGVLIIHLFNLLRVGLLFYLALSNSSQFYYYHKYFFTAALYIVVFGLWALWVIRYHERRDIKATA